ncbi:MULTISPECIES: hypothetical protein [unclassified Rhodococcus (in: high G+C Gram-positive bacteria)]|uniref:hypothetical protein n=1 Tax=unclassified Rhodococcus (in: high G+C Gram-positive bacteria) TaxID=192944 RepID=UPI000E0A4299|nr:MULTISPECIES: hypothetical protein [unclassified Rhodococcus (in: high G+C Gram-positive bacteria)]QKT13083.1 hypothetical protein HUN07_22270 [Rhodococcus sp. W8901]RDI26951.1 hypothetical protein DEU38_108186 [Rhodococcus sp. AG1013]
MDDGTRYRNWMVEPAPAETRPEPRRLLAPLLTVVLALATPLVLPIPVAVVLVLAALSWFGARIQESGSSSRADGALRTGFADGRRSQDPRAYSGEWA